MATARRQLGYVSSLTTQTTFVTGVYGVATGGTSSSITVGGQDYTLLTFTSDSNLVVSQAGVFDVLLIGPGGGGGSGGSGGSTSSGGGGGGGQIVGLDTTLTVYLAAGTYSMDVGAGQAGVTSYAAYASCTDFAGMIQAIGGGVGGAYAHTTGSAVVNEPTFRYGRAGASGGGQAIAQWGIDGVRNSVLNGFNGFAGGYGGQQGNTASTAAGGGGGAGGIGGNGSGTTGGAGGNGKDISAWITGSTYYACAGGGGGGSGTGGSAGNGGVAGKNTGVGNNGVNYGAGGGGSHSTSGGGNGADGAIFVRFKV